MNTTRIAIIVGIILVALLGVWGFLNLRPLLADLFDTPKGTVTVNGKTINVLLADTQKKQEKGLSGKKSLPENQGMLFVFQEADYPSFWMKEMQFPIDIIFINDTTVTTVYENVAPPADENTQLPLYKPTTPSDKVLELNAGQSQTLGIKPGTTLTIYLKK